MSCRWGWVYLAREQAVLSSTLMQQFDIPGQRNGPGITVLRLANEQVPLLGIDVRSSDGENFTPPHTGLHGEADD
jgi:hypothetical protein